MAVRLPLSRAEFTEAKQTTFKEAVAAAADIEVPQVSIVSITDSSGGRRLLAASIEVGFRAEGAREASLDVATLSEELNARGLPAATASPTASTTSSANTTCPIGSYMGDDGTCNLCEVGSYEGGLATCTICREGKTSSVAGSTTRDDCICVAGHSNGGCDPCSEGSYKGVMGSAACTTCGNGATSAVGSTAVSDCICPMGFAGDASGGGSCTACPAGSYKDTLGSAACTTCSNSARSAGGSTAVTDCICAAGVTGSGGYDCTAAVLSLGRSFSCARNAALSLQCWGENDDGELGDGTRTTRNTPVLP
ncbi:hypothetical protein T484DRAFT_3637555 [Baffinella frigidus]|nr:hypothetical protein T484DRAFT_3637555 [Cryptophyta sp. CCMP2293]